MKSRTEVLQWMKDKGIYNVIARKIPYPMERHVGYDRDLESFLVSAFDWRYSREGYDYWNSLNRQFLEWYNLTRH